MKRFLLPCLLLSACSAESEQQPSTPAEKAVAAYLQRTLPNAGEYTPLAFEPPYRLAGQDTMKLYQRPFNQKDDSLLALRASASNPNPSLSDSILANLKAGLKYAAGDTSRVGVGLWHRYKTGGKEVRQRFGVYASGRVVVIDTAEAR